MRHNAIAVLSPYGRSTEGRPTVPTISPPLFYLKSLQLFVLSQSF